MGTTRSPLEAVRDASERLSEILKLEKQGIFVVLVYSLATGLASLAAPVGVQMLVNSIAFGGLVQPIIVLGLMVFVALLLAACFQAAHFWVVERILQRLFVRVAHDLAERLPKIAIRSFDSYHGPELVNRFFEVFTLQKGAAMLLLDGIALLLQMLVGTLLLATYHPLLLALAVFLVFGLFLIVFGWKNQGATASLEESQIKYQVIAWFEDVARNATLFRCVGGEQFALQRSDDLIHQYVHARQDHFALLFKQIIGFLALQAIASVSLMLVGGFLVLRGQITLGQLVAAELILAVVVAGFAKFGKYLEKYYDLLAAMDKLGKLVSLPLERQAGRHLPKSTQTLTLALRVPNQATPVLEILPNARLAILGANGTGKSQLIDILYGMREPRRGWIEANGLPIVELSLRELRSRVALVRGASLFEGSVLENLTMGRTEYSLDQVRTALETVGLWQNIVALPDGINTVVNSDGRFLSSGEMQRLAIARAILARPQLILLDEALDHIAPDARNHLLHELLKPDAPWSVVATTHMPDIAAHFSQQFVLNVDTLAAFLERKL